jgi:hypothetical protein
LYSQYIFFGPKLKRRYDGCKTVEPKICLKTIFMEDTIVKNLIIALATLMTVAAHAETGSEVLYQPKSGESALKFGYDMGRTASFKTTGTNAADVSLTGSVMEFDYMFGVDEAMSVGAMFNTGTEQQENKAGTTKTTSKEQGMSDLYLKMRMTTGMWVYGADLGLPFANHITDGDTSNRNSGGISINPTGGFVMQNDSWNFGGVVTYNLLLDRKTENKTGTTSTTSTLTGGNTLALTPFAEWNFGSGFASAQFTINSITDTTKTDANNSKTISKATNYNTLKIAGSYNFTPAITGLADYTMDMVQANTTASTPAYTASTITVGGRMVF